MQKEITARLHELELLVSYSERSSNIDPGKAVKEFTDQLREVRETISRLSDREHKAVSEVMWKELKMVLLQIELLALGRLEKKARRPQPSLPRWKRRPFGQN